MGIGDLFKAKENDDLKRRIHELEQMLTPEMRDLVEIRRNIVVANAELYEINNSIDGGRRELGFLRTDVESARQQLIEIDEEVLLQEFGLYKPRFDFAKSDHYKTALDDVRKRQKDMIKRGVAAHGNMGWTVNNSKSKGQKMVKDMQKLLLRAFNSECDEEVSKVKFNNIEMAVKRLRSSQDSISKLGEIMSVSISPAYFNLKIDELHLAHEYQIKKQDEKEEQKRIREEMREQAKLQREIEEARREIEKEQKHYKNALQKLETQISTAVGEQLDILLDKKSEVVGRLGELDKSMQEVDYRAANQRAGYVYVISNIGAFGENVYKIGMTRRLEPMDRVDELGDASVPFNFDVHAMIFCEDAPKLEAALHRAFDDRKLNQINTRREFFNVSLDEIEKVVSMNYDKTVEFEKYPAAEQYRKSLLMRPTGANEKGEI